MIKWKKLAATVVAAAAAVSCVGCGNQALAYPLTIDGVKIKAGIYIYYSYQAYTEATSTIQKQNSDLDTTDEEVVKAQTIDGKDAETWIKDRTMEYCKEFVAIQKDFDAKGLELSTEQTNQVKNYISSAWDSSGKTFEKNGIQQSWESRSSMLPTGTAMPHIPSRQQQILHRRPYQHQSKTESSPIPETGSKRAGQLSGSACRFCRSARKSNP